jgi:chaperonin GroEL
LKTLAGDNEDQATGVNIIRLALESPLRTIAENAGQEGSVVVNKVRDGKKDFGYNASDNKYEDFFAAGIIDPTKVARLALENAASIAGLLLTTEAVVSEIAEEKEAPQMPGGGGMGGMM